MMMFQKNNKNIYLFLLNNYNFLMNFINKLIFNYLNEILFF